MIYDKEAYGWLIWWDRIPPVSIRAMQNACRKHNIALNLVIADPLSKGSLISKIRTVFPRHDVVQIVNKKAYRRFQVSKRVMNDGACRWETVDFIRTFADGRVLCETRKDAERQLIDLLNKSTKKVPALNVNKVFKQYIETALNALPVGNTYLVSTRPSKRIRDFYNQLANRNDIRNYIYVLALTKNQNTRRVLIRGATRYLTRQLYKALVQGNKTGNYEKAKREKHRIKRLIPVLEHRLEVRLYTFKNILAEAVLNNPALQDKDEWKSVW